LGRRDKGKGKRKGGGGGLSPKLPVDFSKLSLGYFLALIGDRAEENKGRYRGKEERKRGEAQGMSPISGPSALPLSSPTISIGVRRPSHKKGEKEKRSEEGEGRGKKRKVCGIAALSCVSKGYSPLRQRDGLPAHTIGRPGEGKREGKERLDTNHVGSFADI